MDNNERSITHDIFDKGCMTFHIGLEAVLLLLMADMKFHGIFFICRSSKSSATHFFKASYEYEPNPKMI